MGRGSLFLIACLVSQLVSDELYAQTPPRMKCVMVLNGVTQTSVIDSSQDINDCGAQFKNLEQIACYCMGGMFRGHAYLVRETDPNDRNIGIEVVPDAVVNCTGGRTGGPWACP